MKRLKELLFLLIVSAPYVALAYFLKNDYIINKDVLIWCVYGLSFWSGFVGIFLYKTYFIGNFDDKSANDRY